MNTKTLKSGLTKIAKKRFLAKYARQSGVTVEELLETRLRAYPCDCGEEDCEGWQMLSTPPMNTRKGSEE